ncbi:putative MFS family arabinose efflux permease [Barrientosiimonas humi]|uniref:Putative MFS family arabinose efflux permease n=1 Tax=Barrientosiimonas humi TaxID=999931 RepID=A0A542WZK6_9MICO|nr:MFS transporter [Barrientosiimonas humi]TQL29017.1 putative MFS family arabinose efflux permease [Barrientosiimonas humi]CAG7571494.1 Enterobactin exporter EntS [Barrientosiimonas humi]
MKLSDSWEALRDKDFRWFFIARTVSRTGSSMAPVALAFAVLEVEQKAVALGLVMAARTTATIVFLLVGGVVSDRFSRRVVLQVSHVLTALTQGAVAWLVITGNATVASIVAIEAINGAVTAFTMPAMQGLVPQLVPNRLLQQANALMSFAMQGTTVIGPALAGLIVAGPGAGWALAVDAMTYAIAVLALARVTIPPVARATTSMLHDLREGWSEFTSRQWLWVIVLAFGFLNAIHVGAWVVLGPFIATRHPDLLGERGWGLVLSAEAVGAVLMTVVLMRGQLRHPLRAGMLGVCLVVPALVMLGVAPSVWLLLPVAFAAGMGMEVFGTGWNVALMENVPQRALSRVASYDALGSFVAMPVGATVFGWLAAVADPRWLAVISGVAYLLISLAALAVPSVWRLGRRLPEPAERAAAPGV